MEKTLHFKKIQCVLIEKPPFNDFAVQELISLLDLFDLLHQDCFIHENLKITEATLHLISRANFKFYPFIYLSVEESRLPRLKDLLDRAVCVGRFVEVFLEGASIDEINQKLPGSDYEFTLEKKINDTHCSDFIYETVKRELLSPESFSFTVFGQYKKLARKTKIEHIEQLALPQIQGKCDLASPDRVFILGELYEYPSQKLLRVFWGKDLFKIQKRTPFNSRYALTNRLMLGPTSTEHNLAFLMANMGQAHKDQILIDPFLGTGSILIACSHFEALCFGSEIGRNISLYFVNCLN